MRPILQTRAGKAKTLAQQQSDFTAEGSPPPGHAAAPMPAAPDAPDAAPANSPSLPGAAKSKAPGVAS